MNKQQALREVADSVAAHVSSMSLDEILGICVQQLDQMADTDAERLAEAVSIVLARLDRMGGAR